MLMSYTHLEYTHQEKRSEGNHEKSMLSTNILSSTVFIFDNYKKGF